MDLKKDYNKLYEHWVREFKHPDLTGLNQEDFNNYKNMLKSINTFQVDKKYKIKHQLLESYRKNIDFLFNDLLKIREIKIINAALANQEINLENLIESEKFLYQNLISTFKGHKKIKNLLFSEEQYSLGQLDTVKEFSMEEDILSEDFGPEEIKKVTDNAINQSVSEMIKEKDIDYNYTIIRFLKKTPALVGIDLLNYGPFEENDIAYLPYKNALILVNEKYAEKLDIS